jgi:hypothetical protein
MRWLPRQQYMMDAIGVPFDKPIIQRMKPLNGILQIPAYYADTGTIFRGRLYWFPLIHRCQPIMELAPTPLVDHLLLPRSRQGRPGPFANFVRKPSTHSCAL